MNNLIYRCIFLLSTITALFLSSCEQVVELDIPEHVPSLVVNCVFHPDSSLWASVSVSQGIEFAADDTKHLSGVNLGIYENDQLVGTFTETFLAVEDYNDFGIPITTEVPYYVSDFKSTLGKTYTLKADLAGYESVEAKTTVPLSPNITNIDLQSLQISNANAEYTNEFILDGTLRFDINDPVDQKNYYEIALYETRVDSIFSVKYGIDTIIGNDTLWDYSDYEVIFQDLRSFSNPIYFSLLNSSELEDIFNDGSSERVLTDITFDGQNHTLSLKIENEYIYVANNSPNIELVIKHLSPDYYNYYTSRELQNNNEDNFVSEPVFVYNNIENGYGIFAAYYSQVYPIDLE